MSDMREWIDLLESNEAADPYIKSLGILGAKLGEGSSRIVYEFAPDPMRGVVKVQKPDAVHADQNRNERLLWRHIEEHKPQVKHFFAPVHNMQGLDPAYLDQAILQSRTDPVALHADRLGFPAAVPAFYMLDPSFENFGYLGDWFVCHDYGHFGEEFGSLEHLVADPTIFELVHLEPDIDDGRFW